MNPLADHRGAAAARHARYRFRLTGVGVAALGMIALTGCAAPPARTASGGGRFYDSKLGVFASPRLVADGEAVPRGGGNYLTGRPYTIGGRSYYPSERPDGYTVTGTASWYGDAFHGRRTANGEIFDKNSISAAHPTLPLPSYVRVTNTGNGRSMIVRVNDRGPYHGGRVMDVSQRVAEALNFKSAGTARIRVDYVGRASLRGSDDDKLLATLRTDGGPASLGGTSTMVASDESSGLPNPLAPLSEAVAQVQGLTRPQGDGAADATSEPMPPRRRGPSPVPPRRPYDVGEAPLAPPPARQAEIPRAAVARFAPVAPPRTLVSFAPAGPDPGAVPRPPARRRAPQIIQDAQSEN